MSLESIPTYFSDFMDISLEAAQVILSIVVILAVLLPVFYLARDKGITLPAVMFVLTEALLVGIGWLPSWLMIVTVVIVALALARFTSVNVTGG